MTTSYQTSIHILLLYSVGSEDLTAEAVQKETELKHHCFVQTKSSAASQKENIKHLFNLN